MRKKNIDKIKILIFSFGALPLIFILCCALLTMSFTRIYKVEADLLDKEEYEAICCEYKLDPNKAEIECLFSSNDLYGVRLVLKEDDLNDLNGLFINKMFDDDQEYTHVTAKIYSESNSMLTAPKQNIIQLGGAKIFSENGKYYMELQSYDTNNMLIFCKKINNQ